MPVVNQTSVDEMLRDAEAAAKAGVGGIILFGVPENKDATGTSAWDDKGAVQSGVRALKKEIPELVVITDVCMCEYTDHGHCGVLKNGEVDNDASLELLSRTALSHAGAGADIVAPSDMMDGRVQAIRSALDDSGFPGVSILSYAAKYASAFYGPFREAAESAPQSGDRRGYQLDPANAREALAEIETDLAEGADLIMVKPAMPCLDIIQKARERFRAPLFAYQVSGEYSMLQAPIERGWLESPRAIDESLVAIRRAGADRIITYFAKDFARRHRG